MEVKLKCTDIDSLRYSAANVVTLREQYPNKSDDTLARYLVANNNDVVAASVQLQKADALSAEYANIKMSRCITEIAKGEAYIHGEDRDGRPLIVVNARLHDPVNRNVKESVLMTLWWTEQAIARLPEKHSRFTILLDRDNCENAADTEYMQALAQVFMDLHPERLHRAIVYPSGIVFYSMWNLLLKWFMAENTREKVLPAVSLSDVLQHIDERFIPASLGGKSAYKFDINDFSDPVSREAAVPVEDGGERAADRDDAPASPLALAQVRQDSDSYDARHSAATTAESPDERADSRELEYTADDQDTQDPDQQPEEPQPEPQQPQPQQYQSPRRPRHHVSASSEYELPPNSGDDLLVLRGVLSLEEFEQVPSPREYGSDLGDHFLEEDELADAYDDGEVYESNYENMPRSTAAGGGKAATEVVSVEAEPSAPALVTQDVLSGEDTEGEDVWKEVGSQDGAPEGGDIPAEPVAMYVYAGSQASPCSFVDRLAPELSEDMATPFAYDGVSAPESYHYNVNRSNALAATTTAEAVSQDIVGSAVVSAGADVPAIGADAGQAVEWDCWREVSSDDGAQEEAAAGASDAAARADGTGRANTAGRAGFQMQSATQVTPVVSKALTADAALLTAYVHVALSAVWCSLVACVVGIGLYSVYFPSSVTFSVSVTVLAQLVLLILLLCSFL